MTDAVARIKLGVQDKLKLGNLDAMRDWGFAGDYVKAMWLMLQQERARRLRRGHGRRSIRCANWSSWPFGHAGSGLARPRRESIPTLFRPAEVNTLRGDATRARSILGWRPEVSFPELVQLMVDADLQRVRLEIAKRDCP